MAGDDGNAGNIVDRLFRIKLGALAADLVEDVDQVALMSSSPSSNTANRPTGPAPMIRTSVLVVSLILFVPAAAGSSLLVADCHADWRAIRAAGTATTRNSSAKFCSGDLPVVESAASALA